jgi:type II secretory pathway pseudopilin PulG
MVETRDALLIVVVVVVVPSLHRSTRQSKAQQNQSQAREAKLSVR